MGPRGEEKRPSVNVSHTNLKRKRKRGDLQGEKFRRSRPNKRHRRGASKREGKGLKKFWSMGGGASMGEKIASPRTDPVTLTAGKKRVPTEKKDGIWGQRRGDWEAFEGGWSIGGRPRKNVRGRIERG